MIFLDDGDGTLGNIGNNKYSVHYVYKHIDDEDVYVVYGTGSYTLAEAEIQAIIPPTIPAHLSDFGCQIGTIIAPQSGGSFTAVIMVTSQFFSGTEVANHANLANLDYASAGHTGFAAGGTTPNTKEIGFTLQSTTGDGTTTIDWRLGNKFKFTFGAQNETFTFIAPTNPCTLMLTLIQDGTGSRTVTWPATVKWPSGTAPTLTTTANARDKVALDWDGTQYDGQCAKDFK